MRPISLLLLLIAAGRAIAAEPLTEPAATLGAFTKELQDKLGGSNNAGNDRAPILTQFRQLESALKRGDYDRAQQMLQNLGGYGGIPPALQEQWATLADKLTESIETERQEGYLRWKPQVDELAKRTREACLQAKTTDDLDPILIACAQIQMRRKNGNNGDNIVVQWTNRRIESIARTLEQWARFLDARASGNGAAANAALQQMLGPNDGMYLLTAKDLKPFPVTTKGLPKDVDDMVALAVASVTKLSDLPAAVEQLRKWDANFVPGPSQETRVNGQIAIIENLLAASQAADEGKWDEVAGLLDARTNPMTRSLESVLAPLKDRVWGRLAIHRLSQAVGVPAQPGETRFVYLQRVADQMAAAGKFAELSSFIATVLAQPGVSPALTDFQNPWQREEIAALNAFLLGQRLEAANDILLAVAQYRLALTTGMGSRYVPVDQAQASLKRLIDAHPEFSKDLDGLVLQELQVMREQLRLIQSRLPNGIPFNRMPPGGMPTPKPNPMP